ncbi:MAG: hypothetical protein IJL94_02405 [Erysipelotrichaceae bacterium]|nr:hypothetical protein [Erysipelotrichaceae bacterium]
MEKVRTDTKQYQYTFTPEMCMERLESSISRLKDAEQHLQDARELIQKRKETGYEHYEDKYTDSISHALAIIKQEDMKLMEMLKCIVEY